MWLGLTGNGESGSTYRPESGPKSFIYPLFILYKNPHFISIIKKQYLFVPKFPLKLKKDPFFGSKEKTFLIQ